MTPAAAICAAVDSAVARARPSSELELGIRMANMSLNVPMAMSVARRALDHPDPDVREAARALLAVS